MPTVGLFHEQYWNNNRHAAVVLGPGGGGGGGSYPLWQSGVLQIVALGPALDVVWAKIRWCGRALRLLWRVPRAEHGPVLDLITRWPAYTPQERFVLLRIVALMDDSAWPVARQAVRETAGTLGFNEPTFWKGLSRALKENPGSAQNTFRHLYAVQALRLAAARPLSNPDLHLLVEAAYHAFTAEPKRTMP